MVLTITKEMHNTCGYVYDYVYRGQRPQSGRPDVTREPDTRGGKRGI